MPDPESPAPLLQHLLHGFGEPMNVLVAGASGGIGLAFMQSLATHPQVATLVGVARRATTDGALAALAAARTERTVLCDCDIADEAALAALTSRVQGVAARLHLVINTVGLLHDGALQPEKGLAQVTLASLQATFTVNAFAPILLAKALLPLLRHAEPAGFASLSARVGSIGDNRLGGWYGYRAAKAAQNQLLRTLAIELTRLNPQSIVLALHPGTVDTGLSKPFQARVAAERLFTPAFSAAALLAVIATKQPGDSGNFHGWDDQPIRW